MAFLEIRTIHRHIQHSYGVARSLQIQAPHFADLRNLLDPLAKISVLYNLRRLCYLLRFSSQMLLFALDAGLLPDRRYWSILHDISSPRSAFLNQFTAAKTSPTRAIFGFEPCRNAKIAKNTAARDCLIRIRDIRLRRSGKSSGSSSRCHNLALRRCTWIHVFVTDGASSLRKKSKFTLGKGFILAGGAVPLNKSFDFTPRP